MIDTVLFDIDGVLIDSLKANFEFYKMISEKFGGKKISLEGYKKLNHLTMKDTIKCIIPKISGQKLAEASKYGVKNYHSFHKFIKLNKSVKKILAALSGNYKLGIVTSRTETRILKDLNIEKYFKVIIGINDYSKPKPDPEPILVALKRLKSEPSKTVYVGDMESDIIAGRKAGVKTILYKNENNMEADKSIKDLREIISFLKTCG